MRRRASKVDDTASQTGPTDSSGGIVSLLGSEGPRTSLCLFASEGIWKLGREPRMEGPPRCVCQHEPHISRNRFLHIPISPLPLPTKPVRRTRCGSKPLGADVRRQSAPRVEKCEAQSRSAARKTTISAQTGIGQVPEVQRRTIDQTSGLTSFGAATDDAGWVDVVWVGGRGKGDKKREIVSFSTSRGQGKKKPKVDM